MSITISLKGQKVLRVKNLIFSVLHDNVDEIAEEDNIALSSNIQTLLEKTDQGIYGAGAITADLANYLESRQEALQFAELIQKAIMREYNFFNSYEGCIKHLQEFYQSLITYANQLPQ